MVSPIGLLCEFHNTQPKGDTMATTGSMQTFNKVQEMALERNDELIEGLTLGLSLLSQEMHKELRKINAQLTDLERRVKRLD